MDKEEIKSRIISIKDCNGIKCCADEESVKAVMPQIYAAFRELHNKKINLFTPASTRKRFTSKKNLKKIFKIYDNVHYRPKPTDINHLFDLAIYLGSHEIILKRLTYYGQQQLEHGEQHPNIQSSEFCYSLKELIDEHFFDCNSVVTQKATSLQKESIFQTCLQRTVITRTQTDANQCINLANLNIGSLVGLKNLVEKLKLSNIFDQNNVDLLILDNNHLKKLNLNKIIKQLPRIKKIKARNNFISEIRSDRRLDIHFALNLSNNQINDIPLLDSFAPRINLSNNPLTSRARYHAHSSQFFRNLTISVPLSLLNSYIVKATGSLLVSLGTDVLLTPETSALIEYYGSYIPLPILFIPYGLLIVFLNSDHHGTYKLSAVNSYKAKMQELLMDAGNIWYDLLTCTRST